VIAALLASALLSPEADAAERRYAIVVGNNRGDASEQALQYATADASRVVGVLQSLAGVSPADTTLLHNPDADQVRETIARIERRIGADAAEGDQSLLFIYYSGHADADSLHLSGTRLPLSELKDAVEDGAADARLLIIDACRAGAITRLKGASPVAPFEINLSDEATVSEGMAIITAAAPGEDAQESEKLQGGVFTHHLLTGLQGAADASGDHVVSLDEAFEYARDRTILMTSQAPVVQHPKYKYDINGGGDLPLTRLDGARRTGQLLIGLEGEYIVFDAKSTRVVAEFESSIGGIQALPVGRYVVRRRTPARVYEAEVRVEEGQATRIDGGLLTQIPYGQTARRGGASARRVALAVTAGAAGTGALREGMSDSLGGFAGLRLDSAALTADIRVRYTAASGENDYLSVRQEAYAIDATAYRLWDAGRFAGGAGLRVGGERITQAFDSPGLAPDRYTYALHASPVVRGEVSVTTRVSLGVEGGLSAYVLPYSDDNPSPLTAVPYAAVDLSVFAF